MKLLKLIYLNFTFYLLFILFSAICIPILALVVAILALFSSKRQTLKRIRLMMAWYGRVIIGIIPFPLVKIDYQDFLDPDTAKPCIFICNHRSSSDPFLVACPSKPYECIQIVNIWPFKLPILGIIAKVAGYLSVNEMPFEEFFRRCSDLLKKGISIIAFPEGTRSGTRAMKQFYSAIFRVAAKTKYSIVPVCISGNEHIPSKGSILLRPGTIKIHRLPAIHWDDYKDLTPFVLKNKVRSIMVETLAMMESA